MKPQYTNGATAHQSISLSIPARLINFLLSDNLLPNLNLTHPDPGNQVWILLNMDRTHRENNFKLSLRIRNHRKTEPVSEETTTTAASDENVTSLSNKAGENTSEVLLQIFDQTERFYSEIIGKFPVRSYRGNNYIVVA